MTVHAIWVLSEFPDGYTLTEIQNAVQNWVDHHAEWVDDTVEHSVQAAPFDPDDPDAEDYLKGLFRFEDSDDAATLLDNAEATIQDHVAWYRLGYHVCHHDGQGHCSWDPSMTREYNENQIPGGVETFA